MAADDLEFRGLDYGEGVKTQSAMSFAAAGDAAASAEIFDTSDVVQGDPMADEAMFNVSADAAMDELDGELYGPTDFPERPITHGADFGPGGDFTPLPTETDRQFLTRISTRILERRGQVPEDALIWAMRVLAGE